MPKPRASNLESPSARRKLPVAGAPVWVRLGPGAALGYRRNEAAGTWSVRVTGNGRQWVKRIALADDLEKARPPNVLDYWQALEAARSFTRQQPDAPVDESRPVTVREALDRYAADLKARGASVHNARYCRRYLTAALLAKPVQLLGASELKRWRDSLSGKIKPASVNRMMKGLKAALTLAGEHDPRIANAAARKIGLRGLPDAGQARNVILDDDTVRALVAAAYAHEPSLGLLVDVLAITGTRPSQAARLVVGDLIADPKAPRLLMPRSGKGGSRNRIERKSQRYSVPITPALADRLQAAAARRPANAPLLLQGDGASWDAGGKVRYHDAVREIVAAAGLDPDTVTMYNLRHSAIVRELLMNIPIRVIAATHDTSVAMIESNYSRHIAEHSDELSRRALLQDAPPAGNVVMLTGKKSN
jgi:integrase